MRTAQNEFMISRPGIEVGPIRILLVDEQHLILESLSELLSEEGYQTAEARSGLEALDQLENDDFDLVITDSRIRDFSGNNLLQTLSQSHPDVGVLVTSSSYELRSAIDTMKNGALDYITKPFQAEQVLHSLKEITHLKTQRLREKRLTRDMSRLLDAKLVELDAVQHDLIDHRESTLDVLLKALTVRINESPSQSRRIRSYTLRLARQIGFGSRDLKDLSQAALLHDIGKIGVSDLILSKPGTLNCSEWEEIRRHPIIGFNILKDLKFLDKAAPLILHHHERFDGEGYPRGLSGTQIPFEARIFSVMDSYDAMTAHRPYRRPVSHLEARAEIIRGAGSQFDPAVVETFLSVHPVEWEDIRVACDSNP